MDKSLIKLNEDKNSTNQRRDRSTTPRLANARVHGTPRMRGTNIENNDNGTFEELRLRDSPSPINLTPWNNITLVFKGTGYSTITAADLFSKLRKQIDPHGHYLGEIDTSGFKIEEDNFDLIPLDLELACHSININPAVQLRIRQIKIWAEKTAYLSIQIFEPLERNKSSAQVAFSKRIVEPAGGKKTFGCKLPLWLRENVYHSLDYANAQSPIFKYSTEQWSSTDVQFNIEWKSMSLTKLEFVERIHNKRFERELKAREKLSPLKMRNPPPIKDKDEEETQSAHSLQEIPSRVVREWQEDPVFLKYVEAKPQAEQEHQKKTKCETHVPTVPTSSQQTKSGITGEEVPSKSVCERQTCTPLPEKLRITQFKLIDHTIEALDLLTERMNDPNFMRLSNLKPDNDDEKKDPPDKK